MPRALPPPSPPPLDYAPPIPWRRTRTARRIVLGTILLTTVLVAWRFAPRAWYQARLLYWQRQCMNYSTPSGQIVFSAKDSVSLLAPEWSRFYGLLSPPGSPPNATIFLHEMRSPAGNRRLVEVECIPTMMIASSGTFATLSWHARVMIPGS